MTRLRYAIDAALFCALVAGLALLAPILVPLGCWLELRCLRNEAKRMRDSRGHWSSHP